MLRALSFARYGAMFASWELRWGVCHCALKFDDTARRCSRRWHSSSTRAIVQGERGCCVPTLQYRMAVCLQLEPSCDVSALA